MYCHNIEVYVPISGFQIHCIWISLKISRLKKHQQISVAKISVTQGNSLLFSLFLCPEYASMNIVVVTPRIPRCSNHTTKTALLFKLRKHLQRFSRFPEVIAFIKFKFIYKNLWYFRGSFPLIGIGIATHALELQCDQ